MSWRREIHKNVGLFYASSIYGLRFGLPFGIFKVFLSILYVRFCIDISNV